MIDQINLLKDRGFTLTQIANELNVSIGKVQYQLRKKKAVTKESDTSKQGYKISKEIPTPYELDRVVALCQSPQTIYVYWDIQSTTKHMIAHHFSLDWSDLRKALRIYDVSDLDFNGHNCHRSFDILLPEMTNNWFIRELEENRTYVVDFGISSDTCDFFTIIRSDPIETPRSDLNYGRHEGPVKKWQSGTLSSPEWQEQFSTYSVYRLLK